MSAIQPPPPNTEAALKDAYLTLKNSKEGPGKKEQTFDKLGPSELHPTHPSAPFDWSLGCKANAVSSAETSSSLTYLNNFYIVNSSLISSAATGLTPLDNKTIDATIAGFSESVKVVMDGLDALSEVHPFVRGVPSVFKK
ncbi:hypothetical protein D9756_010367 [Leucocoprinus leucothites]|uniref:Uncharacterized protein n=1 Tax=Leucocoprinus leucothites TaxID=201217 RepID=A0A8H5CRK5_9AGAR|nr:hypothetical protein D9756_010367 [Leucoagaricus leucothites]